jgi:hypothetical protein
VNGAVHLQEHLLRHILGLAGVSQNSPGHAENEFTVTVKQMFEGFLFAAPHIRDEVIVGCVAILAMGMQHGGRCR